VVITHKRREQLESETSPTEPKGRIQRKEAPSITPFHQLFLASITQTIPPSTTFLLQFFSLLHVQLVTVAGIVQEEQQEDDV
jgi:hypothetical protein